MFHKRKCFQGCVDKEVFRGYALPTGGRVVGFCRLDGKLP